MLTVEIREEDCVGCSRCIQVCPVDAIVGANKFMHTILTDECIGCKLCLKPCPTDCIEVLSLEDKIAKDNEIIGNNSISAEVRVPISKIERAEKAKVRFKNRTERLKREAQSYLPDYNSEPNKKEKIKDNILEVLKRKGIK